MKVPSSNIGQTALNGLNRAREQADAAPGRIVEGPVKAGDIVALKLSEHAFKANAAVLGAEKRLHERLRDIFA